ncbi:MAG TPA: aldo/keto reductase [Thermoanaerobaculia bacterium]|nr:aldo/keto reductase [Thermoanaerobaculia bacterium]
MDLSRRDTLRVFGATAAGAFLGASGAGASPGPRTRAIPSSGEQIPVVGLGTFATFDAGSSAAERKPLEEVLARFAERGGRVVDSSPMYGRSEAVVGEVAAKLGLAGRLFLATKVWTRGRQAGIAQMETSERLLRAPRLDLLQVHNLLDVDAHLATLRAWKEAGRVRYIGVTHYTSSAYPELERVLRAEKLDFLQVNCSLAEREAEERILPLAREKGVAVLVNRPFGGGEALRRALGKPLPAWAAEFDCTSWAQFFLKWILANPAVTCAIPATSRRAHLDDDLDAALGRLPDEKLRRRMAEAL